jgi:hypothetical protein
MDATEHKLRGTLAENDIDSSSLALLSDMGGERIYSLAVDGSEAIPLWERLRSLVDQTQAWPVLLGDDETVERILEDMGDNQSQTTAQIIEEGLTIEASEWLKYDFEPLSDDPEDAIPREEWPSEIEARSQYVIPFDSGKPFLQIHVALVPTTYSWIVPSILRFGGWNSCPTPQEHVSILKYWYELYGAEVVGMTADTVEMRISRPPATREAALQLAWEQYTYCLDIVAQGMGTIDALAANLLHGSVWYFWWD